MEKEVDFANITQTPGEEEAKGFSNMMNQSYSHLDVNATPFHAKIKQLDNKQQADGDEFFEDFITLFEEVNKLSVPIKYQQKQKGRREKPLLLLFGEMGNGKSTTGNVIIKDQLRSQRKKFQKSQAFVASKDTSAVTKNIKIKYFTDIALIDTPGFNDPHQQRTDPQIFINICKMLNDKGILDQGIAGLMQCVMVPASGRINKTAVQCMSKMLQVFTLSYPDSSHKGPQIFVLFTNFSKYEVETDTGEQSYDEEEEESKVQQDPQESQIDSNKQTFGFDALVNQFKKDLVVQLMEDQSMTSKHHMTDIVEQLLPCENFFAYKQSQLYSKEQTYKEVSEIQRVVKQTIHAGPFNMVNMGETYLQPILSTNDCREQFVKTLENMLQFCENQTQKAIINYQTHSGGKKSKRISDIHDQLKAIQNTFRKTIIAKPYSLSKAPVESIEQIQNYAKRFSAMCSYVFQQEISQYNKEEADQIKKEMREMQMKMQTQQMEIVERLEQQIQKQREDEQLRKERRKKNIYNPRFANKTCWECGVSGHLIYWCPDLDN